MWDREADRGRGREVRGTLLDRYTAAAAKKTGSTWLCVCVCVCQAAEASRNNGSFLFQLQASCADTVDRNTQRLVRRGVRWRYDLRWGLSACCSATPACPAAQSVVSMDQPTPPCGSPPRRWSLTSTSWGCVGRLNQARWEVCTHHLHPSSHASLQHLCSSLLSVACFCQDPNTSSAGSSQIPAQPHTWPLTLLIGSVIVSIKLSEMLKTDGANWLKWSGTNQRQSLQTWAWWHSSILLAQHHNSAVDSTTTTVDWCIEHNQVKCIYHMKACLLYTLVSQRLLAEIVCEVLFSDEPTATMVVWQASIWVTITPSVSSAGSLCC